MVSSGSAPRRVLGSAPRRVLGSALGVLLVAGCTPADQAARPDERQASAGQSTRQVEVPEGVLLGAALPDRYRDAAQHSTVRRLTALVRATPRGERIRIESHSISLAPIAEELVAAHRRGVHVQVVTMDQGVRQGWRAAEILAELGRDTGADSFVHLVRHGLHEKIWSFSRVGDHRDVVLVGSMNLTYESVGQHTDVLVYRDAPDVRRLADRRFEQVLRELPRVRPRGPARVGGDTWWWFPLGAATDPVDETLAGLPAPGTRVRVVMYAWLEDRGLALAQRLVDLAAAGAEVEVVLGPSVGPRVRGRLDDSDVRVHDGTYSGFAHVHHKLLTVSHLADGERRSFVLTGSDNWTDRSLARAEVLVRRDGRATWRRYDRWIDRLVRRSVRESR